MSQDIKISGYVKNGIQPLINALIKEDGTAFGAITNENGYFELKMSENAHKKIIITALGYKTHVLSIDPNEGNLYNINIDLEEDVLGLDEVVVSGNRYEISRDESPVLVNIIGDKTFRSTQSGSLAEGLNFQSGIRVETSCQNCGFTQVRMNGLEGAYSQILINNRAVFSSLVGVYGLEQMPANFIQRVEVVKGGGSALYGSNAIAGTINVITKDPVENGYELSATFNSIDGDAGDRLINYNASVVNKDLTKGITLYGMHRNRDYYDANGDGFSEITQLENNAVGFKSFFTPTDYVKVDAGFNYINEFRRGGDHFNLDPQFTDITEQLKHNILNGDINMDLIAKEFMRKVSIYTSIQQTNRDSFYGGLGGGRTPEDSIAAANAYGNTTDLALVSGTQFINHWDDDHITTIGAEYQLNDTEDNIPGYNRSVDQRVDNLGIFFQHEWQINNKLKTLLGCRYDQSWVNGTITSDTIKFNYEPSVDIFSPRLTFLYDINDHWQWRANYGRGFRAPRAFNEDLHIAIVSGEPLFVVLSDSLQEETSDSFTSSLRYNHELLGFSDFEIVFEGFYTRLNNPFVRVNLGAQLLEGSLLERVENGTGAQVYGANIEWQMAININYQFAGGLTIQRATFDEIQALFEPENDNATRFVGTDRITRTPNTYGYFSSILKPWDRWTFNISGVYTGNMDVPHVVGADGFMVIERSKKFFDANINVDYTIPLGKNNQLTLTGGVRNVFNSYQDNFDSGPERDSDFIFGPAQPVTYFAGIKINSK